MNRHLRLLALTGSLALPLYATAAVETLLVTREAFHMTPYVGLAVGNGNVDAFPSGGINRYNENLEYQSSFSSIGYVIDAGSGILAHQSLQLNSSGFVALYNNVTAVEVSEFDLRPWNAKGISSVFTLGEVPWAAFMSGSNDLYRLNLDNGVVVSLGWGLPNASGALGSYVEGGQVRLLLGDTANLIYDFALDGSLGRISQWSPFYHENYGTHANPAHVKGVLFDTCRSYIEDSIWYMCENDRVAAFGDQKYIVNHLAPGDIVFLYHKWEGIVAAGKVKSGVKSDASWHDAMYRDLEWLTPKPTRGTSYSTMPAWEIKELLEHGFFWARTIKVPYLSREESEKLLGGLATKFLVPEVQIVGEGEAPTDEETESSANPLP